MTHWYCGSDRTGTNETYRRAYRLVVDTQKSSRKIAKQQHFKQVDGLDLFLPVSVILLLLEK